MNNLLLNHPHISEILQDSPIVIIDGGARGDISPPFDKVKSDILLAIRFEPDEAAPIVKSKNEILINEGLWNKPGEVKFHLAKERSVSSVLPPDMRLIEQLLITKSKIDARKIDKVINVKVTTIDHLIKNKIIPPVDFIKLDIHGSEYEAVEGASDCMKESLLGVLAETWCWPIHQGQKTHAQFEALLNDNGIYLTELLNTGNPKRNTLKSSFDKHQRLKFDSLFFKDVIEIESYEFDKIRAIKFIGLADLFHHHGYALQLNEYFYRKKSLYDLETFELIESNLSKRKNTKVKYYQKISDFLNRKTCSFS